MWLRQKLKDFCAAGLNTLVKRRDKCININILISHALHFMSICDLFTDSSSY
jgi:hypothetical protein